MWIVAFYDLTRGVSKVRAFNTNIFCPYLSRENSSVDVFVDMTTSFDKHFIHNILPLYEENYIVIFKINFECVNYVGQ